MVNRNAAKHLLLVVSILICFFAYMGYRLYGRSEALPEEDSTELTEIPGSSSPLRPEGAVAESTGSGDLDGWVSSASGDELALLPPQAGAQRPSAAVIPESAVPAASSGAITGLIPAPPLGGSPSSMRPPTDSPPPRLVLPPGNDPSEDEGITELPQSLMPPGGLKPPGAMDDADNDSPVSLPAFGGNASEVSMPSLPAATATAVVRPPSAESDPFTSSASAGYPYQEAESEVTPVSTSAGRPPVSAPESRTAPAAEPRSVVTPPPSPRPARPVSEYYGDEGYGEEDDGPPGSETLRIYVVRSGDTLSNIAARELGSISLADNIFLLNRDVIEDPDHLMVGVKIRLPVRDGYVPQEPGSSSAASGRKPTYGTGRSHTIVRGDTLSSIALQYYGSSAAWRFLYEANKTIVPNPNQLTVGTELSIPPYED